MPIIINTNDLSLTLEDVDSWDSKKLLVCWEDSNLDSNAGFDGPHLSYQATSMAQDGNHALVPVKGVAMPSSRCEVSVTVT